jgi:hypothetical protein
MNKLTLCLLFLTVAARAQGPLGRIWDYRYGGIQTEKVNAFISTGGGYLLCGVTESDSSGNITEHTIGGVDWWVVKTNANGTLQWQERYGGDGGDVLNAVVKVNDGYLLAGFSDSGISGDKTEDSRGYADYWVMKTDFNGVRQWDRRYGGSLDDWLNTACATADGGFLLGGMSNSPAGFDKTDSAWTPFTFDYWVVKIDAFGTKLWDKRYGGTDVDQMNAVVQTSDDGFLLCGFSNSDSSGNKTQNSRGGYDYWIVRTDSIGNILWDKRYGGTYDDELFSLTAAGGGNFALAGWSYSDMSGDKSENSNGSSDYWIIRIDANGNIIWDRDFGGNNTEDDLGNIIRTIDGGFLVPTTSYSNISGDKSEDNMGIEQSWLIKVDANGTKEWDKTVFTTGHDEGTFLVPAGENCYAMANRNSAQAGGYKTEPNWDTTALPLTSYDYWIIELCDTTLSSSVEEESNLSFSIYPNPAGDYLKVQFNEQTSSNSILEIKNVLGETIVSTKPAGHSFSIPVSSLANGIFFLTLSNGNNIYTKKFVKQ